MNVLQPPTTWAGRCGTNGTVILGETRGITPGFAEHDLHAFPSLPLPQLLNALCDLPWRVNAQHLLVPFSGICLAVDILPISQFSCSGSINFLVNLGATIIFDPVLNGGDGDNEYERKCRGLWRGGTKHGKH